MNGSVIIFSRFPRLGQVKTRLTSLLGKEGCLELHQALLLDTIDRTHLLGAQQYLYLSSSTVRERVQFVNSFQLPAKLIIRTQIGDDLGARLWNAYLQVSKGQHNKPVVLLGSDSPAVPLEYIHHGLHTLAETSVVLGPAEDGGYYLIGLSRPRPELFSNIDWGSKTVLARTLQRLNLDEYTLLPCWFDVDDVDDLARLRRILMNQPPGFLPHTRHCLERLCS